jgi:hypothetical protein
MTDPVDKPSRQPSLETRFEEEIATIKRRLDAIEKYMVLAETVTGHLAVFEPAK